MPLNLMGLPDATARIQAIEFKLIEIDPILLDFCFSNGFTISRTVEMYPSRRVWQRTEIDRTLHLRPDLSVQRVVEAGFYPEMPWSLYALASLLPETTGPTRLLSIGVFEGLPYTDLADALPARLQEGHELLKATTRDQIISKGQVFGGVS